VTAGRRQIEAKFWAFWPSFWVSNQSSDQ